MVLTGKSLKMLRLLKVTNGTVTSTNAIVVTRINTIKDNYMIEQ